MFLHQTIQEGICALRSLITNVEDTGSDLTELSGPGEGSAIVEHRVTECRERYDRLYQLTEERGIKISITLQQEEQIEQKLEELLNVLEKKRDDFSGLEPVGVHPETIKEQMEVLKVNNSKTNIFLSSSSFLVCLTINSGKKVTFHFMYLFMYLIIL